MISVVGTRYARALLDIVMRTGSGIDPKDVLEELRRIAGMIADAPDLRNALLSPAVSPARKRAVMERLIAPFGVSKAVRNFIFVVIDHRRITGLDSMVEAYGALLDERLGFVRADISSASALDESQQGRLVRELSRLTKKQAKPSYVIDPTLIGGVIARVGSLLYDGSVRGQLEKLRLKLGNG